MTRIPVPVSALLLGFGGVSLLAGVTSTGFTADPGVGLLLASALALAAGNLVLKTIAGRIDAVVANGIQLTLGALPLFGVAAWAGEPLRLPAESDFWLALLVLAGTTTALGTVLWQYVLSRAPLNQINAVNFLIPVYGLPLMLTSGATVTGWQWAGGGVVLLAVAIVLFDSDRDVVPLCPSTGSG